MKHLILTAALTALAAASANAAIVISEVDPTGSSTASYAADWFELTNTGVSAVNIAGWKMDDNSDSFSLAVPLTGVTSISAGQSVVFIEDTGTTAAAVETNFESAWFGSNVPVNFSIGAYGGSGVGLGSSGDQVNIFDSTGAEIAGVAFGASTSGFTFDNSAGLSGTGANDPTISTLSVLGVNGAFRAADDSPSETGSPGLVPEPSTWALLGLGGVGALALALRRRV